MNKFFIIVGIAGLLASVASAEEVECKSPPSRSNNVYYFVNQLRTGVLWLQSPGPGEIGEWTNLGNATIVRQTTAYSFRASLTLDAGKPVFNDGECFAIGSTTYSFVIVPDVPVLEDGGSTIPVDQYASRVTIANNLIRKSSRKCRRASVPRQEPFQGKLDCRTPIQR